MMDFNIRPFIQTKYFPSATGKADPAGTNSAIIQDYRANDTDKASVPAMTTKQITWPVIISNTDPVSFSELIPRRPGYYALEQKEELRRIPEEAKRIVPDIDPEIAGKRTSDVPIIKEQIGGKSVIEIVMESVANWRAKAGLPPKHW